MNSWRFCWACGARASRWRCTSWKARGSSRARAIASRSSTGGAFPPWLRASTACPKPSTTGRSALAGPPDAHSFLVRPALGSIACEIQPIARAASLLTVRVSMQSAFNPEQVVQAAVAAVASRTGPSRRSLDELPGALYVTDTEGLITTFNKACIGFAGRVPALNRDRWCVTWKLFREDDSFLPHDHCPIAVA